VLGDEFVRLFPSSSFRKYQREVLLKVGELFESGVKCVLLDAPTGFGKSYVNTAVARYYRSFYSTPQLSLIEQILHDPRLTFIFKDVKGRQNYRCVHDTEASVDEGMCTRSRSYPCEREVECPYWKRKLECMRWSPVLTSFSYLILEGRVDGPKSLGKRELLVVDEGHSIDRHVLNHVSLYVSPLSLGRIYGRFKDKLREFKYLEELAYFLGDVYEECKRELRSVQRTIDGGVVVSREEAAYKRKLEEWVKNAELFFESTEKEWVWSLKWATSRGEKFRYLEVMPVYARDYAPEMLWKRAERYIVSSATILEPNLFVKETGLDKVLKRDEVVHLKVPSTFPPENRPVIDATVGKLTVEERNANIGKAVRAVEEILEVEKGNVAIHCHSYEFSEMLRNYIGEKYKGRIVWHESADRQEKLEEWKRSRGKVFLAVAFTEGQDWKGEIADAQILLKVPYPDADEDPRVKRRLEKGEWVWYRLEALKETIQAYGRAVRAPDERKRFYVVDSSFENLISWAWRWVPDWFKSALPPHWNKEMVAEVVRRMKAERREKGVYRGASDAELKREAVKVLKGLSQRQASGQVPRRG